VLGGGSGMKQQQVTQVLVKGRENEQNPTQAVATTAESKQMPTSVRVGRKGQWISWENDWIFVNPSIMSILLCILRRVVANGDSDHVPCPLYTPPSHLRMESRGKIVGHVSRRHKVAALLLVSSGVAVLSDAPRAM